MTIGTLKEKKKNYGFLRNFTIVTETTTLSADFDTMFASLSVPMLLVDDKSQVLNINDSGAKLFRMERELVRGQFWAGLDAQLTLIQWRQRLNELKSDPFLTYTTDILTENDFLRPVRIELCRIAENQNLIRLADVLHDRLRDGQVDLMSEATETGFWFYNRVDRHWYVSPIAGKLLGLSPGFTNREVIDSFRQNLTGADWQKVEEVANTVLNDTDTFSHQIRIEGEAGSGSVKISGRSISNALHVTLVYGIVEPVRESVEISGKQDHISGELASFSIDQARDMIFWTGSDGSVSFVNQTVCAKLGYSREDLTALRVFDFVKDFGVDAIDTLYVTLREVKSLESEFTLIARDGGEIEISAVVNYLRFGDKEYACSFCRDITHRKLKDQRRRLSEFTIDQSVEMVVWSNPDGSVHFVNETFLKKTGYSAETAGTLNLQDIFTHITAENMPKMWSVLSASGSISKEVSMVGKDGDIIPVSATLNHLVFEDREFSCSLFRDISNKKRRDAIIELSHMALDSAGDCVLWLDEEYRVTYLNQTLLNLLKNPKESLEGVELYRIFPSLSPEDIVPDSVLDITFDAGREGVRHLNLNCTSLEHDQNRYFMLVGRDVTRMSERREELEEAYTEIRGLQDRLQEENISLRQEVNDNYNINNIITVSPKYQQVLRQIGKVADTDATVLITGETGTGKELLARAVHQLSERSDYPMVKVNCAALPENLIESELFGHEKGAFTGAFARKKGRFEVADTGTIFLDEVGEMPLELQSKLLRVLQEGEFERVGGAETIRVDVRLVAATNRNLEEMVAAGKFRADLYYRLNVFPINNLPLRDRPEDIPVLVEHFVQKFGQKQGKNISKISKGDMDKLRNYPFPGNIRELENMIERAVVLTDSETLSIRVDPLRAQAIVGEGKFLSFEEMQRKHIVEALKFTGGRVTGPEGAGVLLKMNDRTLVSKMRKLDIKKREYLL